jgi:hypothetical protein
MDSTTPTKAQLRWRRNKRDQRARTAQVQAELSAEFLERVEVERLRRQSWEAYEWAWNHPDLNYFTSKGGAHWIALRGSRWHAFAADVWAATLEIEAGLGAGKATPTRISRYLEAKGRLHGYTTNSARVMVPRARFTIAALEQAAVNDPNAGFWLPFKP